MGGVVKGSILQNAPKRCSVSTWHKNAFSILKWSSLKMQLTDEKVDETDRMKIEYERNVKLYQKDKSYKKLSKLSGRPIEKNIFFCLLFKFNFILGFVHK